MAVSEKASEPRRLAISSYQTALCVMPPAHLCQDIDRLRALYDNAYDKWPAHINVIYPFVAVESLPQAVELIQSKLVRLDPDSRHKDIHLRLDKSDHFSHPHSDTIYIAASDGGGVQSLKQLRSAILEALKQDDEIYRPHLTIGQSRAQDASLCEHLLAKANLLLPIEWQIEELVVLVRERGHERDHASSQMKIWGTIDLSENAASKAGRPQNFREQPQTEEEWSDEEERRIVSEYSTDMHLPPQSLETRKDHAVSSKPPPTQPGSTYQFSAAVGFWRPVRSSVPLPSKEQMPSSLTISSYNVLVDSVYPQARDRFALLLRALLSESALADILVLQEVSDDFLSYLLEHGSIRSRYPFTTHGPPDQLGVGPLASLRNIIVLSRWNFNWKWVPFERRHKGTVVLVLENIGTRKDSAFVPLVVAGVHLTCGLTDSSVAAKKSQLQTLVNHLSRNYPENPWIVAGDFNLTTSFFTIDAALKNKSISLQTASTISSLDTILSEARLSDCWLVARAELGGTLRPTLGQTDFEDLYEGEQGATFNPMENPIAAGTGGRGSNKRPQRYDRIFVKGEDFQRVTGFNMFGFPENSGSKTGNGRNRDQDSEPHCGSDHWGIRATLSIDSSCGAGKLNDGNVQLAPLQFRKAPLSLVDIVALKSCLTEHSMIPTDEEVNKRKEVFALLKGILQQSPIPGSSDTTDNMRSNISMVVVPVGSYGLGVWSTSSDIDCLSIGSISSKTFFTLAGQRLRKAVDLGVRILRKVKAASGTMLELDVRGIKLDLQYCPATKLVERYVQLVSPFVEDINWKVFYRILIPIKTDGPK
jgi:2'-5' RNA ligase